MTLTRRTRVVLVALVVATALLTAETAGTGVAAAGNSNRDLDRVARSGDELVKSGSAKFRGRSRQDAGGAGSKVAFDGTFDFSRQAGEYSTSLAALGVPGNEKVRGLLLNGTVLLGLNALRNEPGFESVPEGKEWLQLDPAVFGTSEVVQRDPSSSLDALRGATGRVTRVGTDEVRGVDTTHYRVTLDLAKAISNAPEAQRDRVETSVIALGTRTIPADVWIDGKGRVRKLRLRLKGGTVVTPGSVEFEFFDLGTKVDVPQPDPNSVVDLGAIVGGATTEGPG
ncbi:MAG TPA: hypothetical protein VKE97_00770 [Acidimicrobiia bacterium]|nr:hypothetical protein [Acidimicrobiia bacterium]